jgi:integral membrane protein
MADSFDSRPVVKAFRVIAVAEACSWAALLVAMCFKYIPADGNKTGVMVCGWIHGLVFTAFVVLSIATGLALRWKPWITLLALVSSVPPFCSVVFEQWAARTGRLVEQSAGTPRPVAAAS